jgi:hypothetical protein
MIFDISGNSKSSIYAVDGCRDSILIWVTRFKNIYMKVPDGIPILNKGANHNMYCVKLKRSFYGLKQSGRM